MIGLVVCLAAVRVVAAEHASAEETASDESLVALNFPANVELKVFIEYVSQRLSVNILYDEQEVNKRITIKAPTKVPVASLLDLLESALQMKGLLLIDAKQPGWKRIVPIKNLTDISRPAPPEVDPSRLRPSEVLTQIFNLQFASPERVEPVIKPFLTEPGGNSIPITAQGLLVVTDFASNMPRIANLITLMDKPPGEVVMRFLGVDHLTASDLAAQVTQLLGAKSRARGEAAPDLTQVLFDERTNQLIVIGPPEEVEEAQAIAASLDVPLGLKTQVYQLAIVSPERIDRLAKELIDPVVVERLYRSTVDKEAGLLVVTTTPDIHERIASLQADLDVPAEEAYSPIRMYKLENADAVDVLNTIRAIEGQAGLETISVGEGDYPPPPSDELRPGPVEPRGLGIESYLPKPPQDVAQEASTFMRSRVQVLQGRDATVTADPNTNSIIVVADPSVQRVYEQLIKMLDRRRPQVLIEATIVTLDTTDDYSLGVEVAGEFSIGSTDVLLFTSFGLSGMAANGGDGGDGGGSGGLLGDLMPGLGFNGSIVSPGNAEVIIRALQIDTRAKVQSAPRILVNDNATGSIEAVAEAPFTSVNASNTVSTTSFGGFVTAGTSISVTPHIAEGDHLRLEFTVALNSFSGEGSDGVPPPRQTNAVQSEITVPDGYTIIVGGINRADESETKQSVPFLGDIPLVEYLFSSRTETGRKSTLFVFIRPIILRDDQFEDLKYLSGHSLAVAELPGNAPASSPMIVH